MADTALPSLTAGAACAAADLFYTTQGGNSRKVTGAQLQTFLSSHPGYVAGRWYLPQGAAVGAGGVGQDTIQLTPFVLTRAVTISDLATRITTALAANNVQLAIYANATAASAPTGNPLAATGNISTASAVTVSADIVGADVTLQPGMYWAAINHSGATSVAIAGEGVSPGFTGMTALVGTATLATAMTAASTSRFKYTFVQSFGTWPDLTGQTMTEVAGSNGPVIAFKAV